MYYACFKNTMFYVYICLHKYFYLEILNIKNKLILFCIVCLSQNFERYPSDVRFNNRLVLLHLEPSVLWALFGIQSTKHICQHLISLNHTDSVLLTNYTDKNSSNMWETSFFYKRSFKTKPFFQDDFFARRVTFVL